MILEEVLRAEARQSSPGSGVTCHPILRESLKACGFFLTTSEPEVSSLRQCKMS